MRTGRLTDDDWATMTVALGKLHDAPIHIDETGASTPPTCAPAPAGCIASAASSA